MTIRIKAALWGIVAWAAAGSVPATGAPDEWEPDDTIGIENVLLHGSEQTHDLIRFVGGGDQDFYAVFTHPFSSYQVVVHSLNGTLDLLSEDVQLMNAAGTQAVMNALVTDAGGVLSLQWHEGNLSIPLKNYVKVHGAACGATCDDGAIYRIRFYDTTLTVPRVNNSGTQSTVLLVQNVTNRPCTVSHHYFDNAGSHQVTGPLTLMQPRALDVVATAATFPDQSGSVRVTHTCGYGGLSGKAVSLETSTGFTFDTPFVHRPH